MPAVFDSLVHQQGLTPHKAWRVAYIVPFIIITAVALGMLFTCQDTPTGKWSERNQWMEHHHHDHVPVENEIVDTKSGDLSTDPPAPVSEFSSIQEKKTPQSQDMIADQEAQSGEEASIEAEVIIAPTTKEALHVTFSLETLAMAATYACSFGAELAIESILGSYYAKNFPHLGQTETGRWAAMFGLLNVVFRPIGGYVADRMYHYTNNLWWKKMWLTFLGVVMGAFQLAIGLTNPHDQSTMFGLAAGLAFFLEACNGANFALVPHVHPYANGEFITIPFLSKQSY